MKLRAARFELIKETGQCPDCSHEWDGEMPAKCPVCGCPFPKKPKEPVEAPIKTDQENEEEAVDRAAKAISDLDEPDVEEGPSKIEPLAVDKNKENPAGEEE